jgi:Rieske Fe-S protein
VAPDEQPPVHEAHPSPTIWPIGFAIGIVVVLVGLVIDPLVVSTIGAVIVIVCGFFWILAATKQLRGAPEPIEPERRPAPADGGEAAAAELEPASAASRFPRNKFLEASTVGLGAAIGGLVTLPVLGFIVLPSFIDQKSFKIDLGPLSEYPAGKWYIATFVVDPAEGETSRRTVFVRYNGDVAVQGKGQQPSFTLILNRCAHLGCPVQANGPMLGKSKTVSGSNGRVELVPVQPAGFGCPCHGGQYDTEGNRTAGPPTHALDRYNYAVVNGRLVLTSLYTVSHVTGEGAQAIIYKYKYAGPGLHVDGPEQWFYPLVPPHN